MTSHRRSGAGATSLQELRRLHLPQGSLPLPKPTWARCFGRRPAEVGSKGTSYQIIMFYVFFGVVKWLCEVISRASPISCWHVYFTNLSKVDPDDVGAIELSCFKAIMLKECWGQ